MGIVLVTAPTVEPVDLAEAKLHLRVDITDDDILIKSLIVAARRYAEMYTGRAFCTQTWDLKLDNFPGSDYSSDGCIYVPRPPLSSVTSITYVDSGGTSQTWAAADYRVDTTSEPGRITPAYGETWPTTQSITNAVTVRFVAGYGGAGSVPETIKAAMLLYVASLYENREDEIVGTISKRSERGVDALLWGERVLASVTV